MIYQPRDIGALTYKLIFNNTNEEFEIDSPIGIDEIPIKLVQGEKYERHIEYEDQEIEFQPNRYILGHQFEKLVQYYTQYSYEAFIELKTYIKNELISTIELDFENVTTNKENFFKVKIKNSDLRKIVEEKKDIKVDLLASKSLKGSDLVIPEIHDVKLRAKKIREISSFELSTLPGHYKSKTEVLVSNKNHHIFPFGKATSDDISDTGSYSVDPNMYISSRIGTAGEVIEALKNEGGNVANIQNFKINTETVLSVKRVFLNVITSGIKHIVNAENYIQLAVINYTDSEFKTVKSSYYIEVGKIIGLDVLFDYEDKLTVTIPAFSRVVVEVFCKLEYRNNVDLDNDYIIINEASYIQFEATEIFKESTAKMLRLIDSGKSILNNLTDNSAFIIAPRFKNEFWEYFVTSGFYLRGFNGESIDIKWSDWLKFIQNAFNCDVQFNGNDIFIGKHEDFYQNIEIARFEFQPDKGDDYEISLNERLKCNSFKLKYNKFEDEERDTLDAFHTESEWYIPSRIKNDFEGEINFIADGYSIEYARREGIETQPTTSKSKDNDIYIIDCFETYHTGDEEYYYYTNRSVIPGFELGSVSGMYSSETSYNLRLSLKRLMIDHYSHYLAELSQKFDNGNPNNTTLVAQNTFYKANGNLESKANASIYSFSKGKLKDNSNILNETLNPPLVTPDEYSFTLGLRLKYNEVMNLIKDVLDKKGYITFFDENSELKLFPKEIEYDQIEEKLTFIGEKKYD